MLCWSRERQSHSDTVILPGKVTVHSVAVSSPSLRAQTTVLGSVPTLGLDIARFINKYQVQLSLSLSPPPSLPPSLPLPPSLSLSLSCD